MELLLVTVPSKLGLWTLEESLTMIKKISKLWSWDLDAFKEKKSINWRSYNELWNFWSIHLISKLFHSSSTLRALLLVQLVLITNPSLRCADKPGLSGASCPNPARGPQRKTQLLQCANAHLSHFIHPHVKALDRDTAWLKSVKPRCVGIAAGAQVGPKPGRRRGKMISSSVSDNFPSLMTLKSDQWSQKTCVRGERTSSKVGNSSPTLLGPQVWNTKI